MRWQDHLATHIGLSAQAKDCFMSHYLYAEGSADRVQTAAQHLEILFEEEGFAISNFEIDEDTKVWALSLYPSEESVDSTLASALDCLKQQDMALPLQKVTLPDEDWVTKSLEGLVPVEAGRFVIHGSHDAGMNTKGRIPVQINAGQAFGTGHHGTTAGCLKVLSQELKQIQPERILDLGTGSAVLAIALAKLLKTSIIATDIDAVSIETSRDNVRINEVHPYVKLACASGFSHPIFSEEGPFDLIVANILAGPLCHMAKDVAANTMQGGRIVLSGLLPHQKAKVVAAYRQQGFYLLRAVQEDGWLVLVFQS